MDEESTRCLDTAEKPQSGILIRNFEKADIPELLRLMQELARFENYYTEFAVTKRDIEERGLGTNPQFHAIVAEIDGMIGLVGMAVSYLIPYTYTLQPDLILKELFIDDHARGLGIGTELFKAVKALGISLGCRQVLWKVMTGNSQAECFYRNQGGMPDKKWENWVIELE